MIIYVINLSIIKVRTQNTYASRINLNLKNRVKIDLI